MIQTKTYDEYLNEIYAIVYVINKADVYDKHDKHLATFHWYYWKRNKIDKKTKESILQGEADKHLKKLFGNDIKIKYDFDEFDVS